MPRPCGTPLTIAFGADQVRAELMRRLATRGASKKLAHAAGVSTQLLWQAARGRIPPSERVAAAVGFRRVTRFVRIDESCPAAPAEAKVE